MTIVLDSRGWSEVPDFWDEKNWARPYHFLKTVSRVEAGGARTPGARGYLTDKITSGFAYRRAVLRSSLTKTSSAAFPEQKMHALLRCTYQALAAEPHLVAGLVTQDVDGWVDGYWTVQNQPRHIQNSFVEHDSEATARLIQGQAWATGPGVIIVLGMDWSQVGSTGEDVDVAYADALIGCGRVGQALVLEGQHHDVVARMTPAVHESTAAELFRLPQHVSALYAIRLAEPS